MTLQRGHESQSGELALVDPVLAESLRAGFQSLAPSGVAFAVAPIGLEYELMEPEPDAVASAAKPRQLEFSAGRWCARQALGRAGGPSVGIGAGLLREPLWPRGFAGSIAHGRRFAAAAAYRLGKDEAPSVGIDLIDDDSFDVYVSIAHQILSPEDCAALGGQTLGGLELAKVFSAKEAAVKILSPRIGRFIDFAEIALRPSRSGTGYLVSHRSSAKTMQSSHAVVSGVIVTIAVG